MGRKKAVLDPVAEAERLSADPTASHEVVLKAMEAAMPHCRTESGNFLRMFAMRLMQANGKHTEQVVSLLEQAVALEPFNPGFLTELGAAYGAFSRFDDALRCYDEALRINPNQNMARSNRSMELLSRGNWAEGFEEFKTFVLMGKSLVRSITPEWDGRDIGDKTLYLWCDQGLGDAVMFLRFVKDARKAAGPKARIIVEMYESLLPIFGVVEGADHIAVRDPSLSLQCPTKDPEHASIARLPAILGLKQSDLAPFPYPAGFYQRETINTSLPIRVGLVCHASKREKGAPAKSWTAPELFAIGERLGPDFELVSLQYNEDEDTAKFPMQRPALTTFAETAKVIQTLDIVVGVDSVVPHVAGAMGCPVLLLVAKTCDWRWERGSERTHWYKNHYLFRQTVIGDWAEPIERIVKTLLTMRDKRQEKGIDGKLDS